MDTRLKVRRRGGMEVWRRAEGCVDVEVWNSGGALRVVTNCAEGVQTWRHGALEACGRREDGGMEVRVARVGQQVCIHGCMEVQSSRTLEARCKCSDMEVRSCGAPEARWGRAAGVQTWRHGAPKACCMRTDVAVGMVMWRQERISSGALELETRAIPVYM